MTMDVPRYLKPLPSPTPDSEPYWEGCREGELRLRRCSDCARFRFYPRAICPFCGADRYEWVVASGRGVVHAVTVVHRGPTKAFAPDCPYAVALIELAEGPRMMSNVIGCAPDEVAIGMPVEVVFDRVTDEIALPKFRPAGDRAPASGG
jgi:uncharacterized OB-fold protein